MCLNVSMKQEGHPIFPGFPEERRSHHRWRPGTVLVSWDLRLSAARAAILGHVQNAKLLRGRVYAQA